MKNLSTSNRVRLLLLSAAIFSTTLTGCVQTPDAAPAEEAGLHARLLTLDTHLDTPVHFARPEWSFGDRHTLEEDLAQLDIPRMADGNLDGGFFVVFTGQGPLTDEGYAAAKTEALRRSDVIDTVIDANSAFIGLVTKASEAQELNSQGRLIAFKSIENSYPMGLELSNAEEFYNRGVRMAGPVHSLNNQFADSSNDKTKYGGLSDLGRDWVSEMNRLGILIDGSHASDAAFDQMVELSETPLVLSHTSPRALFDHPRNLDDERIRKLAESGGAICVSAIYLSHINMTEERSELWDKLDQISSLSPREQSDLSRRWQALNQSDPLWSDNFERYMNSLLHVIDIAGVDHVCFGADWDGGGGFQGIEDITDLPKITNRLMAEGYSETDIEKMWSGNLLRLLTQAQAAREK